MLETLLAAKSVVESEVMAHHDVLGFGIGEITNTNLGLKVFIRPNVGHPEIDFSGVDGIPVTFETMYPPLSGDPESNVYLPGQLTHRARPAVGGFSAAHYRFRYGTIGAVFSGSADANRWFALGNNHVFANLNNARRGDPILQPGRADGGTLHRDEIGVLHQYEQIRFDQYASNLVDAAVVEVDFAAVERDIYYLGHPVAVMAPKDISVGTHVSKVGRGSGLTSGEIRGIFCSVKVHYGSQRVARFHDQLVLSSMCADGDSGSLLMDVNRKGIGLVFAFSNSHTIANYLQAVEETLHIDVVPNHMSA